MGVGVSTGSLPCSAIGFRSSTFARMLVSARASDFTIEVRTSCLCTSCTVLPATRGPSAFSWRSLERYFWPYRPIRSHTVFSCPASRAHHLSFMNRIQWRPIVWYCGLPAPSGPELLQVFLGGEVLAFVSYFSAAHVHPSIFTFSSIHCWMASTLG